MKQFWEWVKESTATQGAVTIMLTGTVCYLAVVQQPIPDLIAYGFTGVLGFFFGAKVQQAAQRSK